MSFRESLPPVLRLLAFLTIVGLALPPGAVAQGFGPDEPIAFIGHGAMFGPDGKEIEPTLEFLERAQDYYETEMERRASPEAQQRVKDLSGALDGEIARMGAGDVDRPLRLLAQTVRIGQLAAGAEIPPEVRGKLALIQSELTRRIGAIDPTLKPVQELRSFLEGRIAAPGGGTVLFSTVNQGANYIAECEANGVPIPPGWNEPGWTPTGALSDAQEFISANREGRPYVFSSTSPPGTCIALPRFYDNGTGAGDGEGHLDTDPSTADIQLLGIICLGTQTSKACFWDNSTALPDVATTFKPSFDIQADETVPLAAFNGGAGLLGAQGGVCTECHAGENSFVIHPGTPLGLPALGSVDLFGDDWYDPLVHPTWPQNAGPTDVLATIPSPGRCDSCHQQGGTGGRFPLISSTVGSASQSGGYCAAVLNQAIPRTMPPGNPADPAYAAHETALSALCSAPAKPVLRLENAVIDYNEVALGFAFAKAIVVHNDGDANLTVSVSLTTVGGDTVHWSDTNEIADFVIAPGDDPLVLRQVYQPQGLGNHAIAMQVTSSDPSAATINVSLVGEGVSPRPIDTLLVLDRSGSMSDPAGDRLKIEALRDAATLYTDLLREDVGGTGTGDKLGFVKYNDTNAVYMPLTTIAAGTQDAIAGDELSSAAISDTARIGPQGGTGIGGAMILGADTLGPVSPDRSQVLVVLTDGIENAAPFIDAAVADLQANHATVQTYSVGLGFDIEPTKLQSITNMGDEGYHQVVSTLSEETLFDLETFYFKIFSSATGMDLVTDPTHVVDLKNPAAIVIDRATVISSDRNAVFLVMEDPMMRGLYDLEFVSPNGTVIAAGASVGGIAVQEQTRNTYRIFRVVFPDPVQASEYVGDWLLRVKPNGKWNTVVGRNLAAESRLRYGGNVIQPILGTVPIGFAGAVSSDYRMQVSVTTPSYLPGAELKLTAGLTDRGWPAANGDVHVEVTAPNGVKSTVVLHDDGLHSDGAAGDAVWAARFAQTAAAGSYRLLFSAQGTNERGELAPRLATRFVTLARPEPTPGGNGPGGDRGGVASYLIGSFDLRFDNRSFVTVINPTGETVAIALALFNTSGQSLRCIRDKLPANGLAEYDIERLDPNDKHGVVKVLALDPNQMRPVLGIVGNQLWTSDRGRSETQLHPVPDVVLRGDLPRIREACGF